MSCTGGGSPYETAKAKGLFAQVQDQLLSVSRVLALLVLIIYFPAMVAVGLLVLFTSPGPAFVKKGYKRAGGEVVYLYEFRTEDWRTWQDTPVGTLLRTMDLHRLPRLVNVLTGEVAVGERLWPAGA